MFFNPVSDSTVRVPVIALPAYKGGGDDTNSDVLPLLTCVRGAAADASAQGCLSITPFTAVVMPGVGCERAARLACLLEHEEEWRREAEDDSGVLRKWRDAAAAGGDDGDDEDAAAGDRAGRYDRQGAKRSRNKTKFVQLTEEDFEVDWYEVLGITDGDALSEEELKAAYRRRCLETHPDKMGGGGDDELFKRVQKAFDILGDPETRQTYDSSRPFDDAIPPEERTYATDEDFFRNFAPVFERNKKWCSFPLPSLGTSSTSVRQVQRFYDAWGKYHSWRDFSHLADLTSIDEGMNRDEKRFYTQENNRVLGQFIREEQKRIRNLVERAKKNDPRLRRHREAEERERQRQKDEREAFRRRLREEEEAKRAQQARLEREAREAEEKKAAAEKDAIKDCQKRVLQYLLRAKLIDKLPASKLLAGAVRQVNIQWLFARITTVAEAEAAAERVTSASTQPRARTEADSAEYEGDAVVDAVIAFNKLVQSKEVELGVNRYGEGLKKPEENAKRSKEDAKPAKTKIWEEDDISRLHKATAKYPPGSIDRWPRIASMLQGRFTPEEAMAKFNELTAALSQAGGATTATGASAGSGAAAAAAAATSVEDWTVKQQKQLEQVLRELKDYKEKDKFQRIAEKVEGKTAKECFDRFKFLCSVNKKK